WSADGKVLATGDLDLVVQVWNLGSDKVRFRTRRLPGVVSGLTFSPCGRWLGAWWQQIDFAAVAARKTAPEEVFRSGVVLWRLDTGAELFAVEGGPSLAFSADGKQVAIGALDGTIRLWDVERKQVVQQLRGHTGALSSMVFRPMSKKSSAPLLATSGM